ncbi:MAG: helix-turn-helix domain-containing protein [Bacteroidota bacterium]|nr:helix-turn-helix domain-containing protein [Bacteroidota bacterium]
MKGIQTKNRFVELRAQGISYEKIATELNVSKQTLISWSKRLQIEILNLRAIQLEVLQEKYFLTKEKKIEFIGNILNALKAEADKRDLTKLSDRELLELILKFSEKLDKEVAPDTFRF